MRSHQNALLIFKQCMHQDLSFQLWITPVRPISTNPPPHNPPNPKPGTIAFLGESEHHVYSDQGW